MSPKDVSDLVRDVMTYALLLSNFIAMLMMWISKAKAPETAQNERIRSLEEWRKEVEDRLETGNSHFDKIDKGNRVTQEALLAIMSHELNGNDTDKLKEAKHNLETFLIEK